MDGTATNVKAISVYIQKPIIRAWRALWKEKGIKYSFDKQSSEWLNILLWLFTMAADNCSLDNIMRRMQGQGAAVHAEIFHSEKVSKVNKSIRSKDNFPWCRCGTDEAKSWVFRK